MGGCRRYSVGSRLGTETPADFYTARQPAGARIGAKWISIVAALDADILAKPAIAVWALQSDHQYYRAIAISVIASSPYR